MRIFKWIWNKIFHRNELQVSNQWLVENEIKEASGGWADGPRWRFPEEIIQQERLERKRRMSLVRSNQEARERAK